MSREKLNELVTILKEEEGFLGIEMVENKIRVFVDSMELRDELSLIENFDVFVGRSKRIRRR